MEKPILTSDLSFAHTVCGNAALYFDNTNPEDISSKIKCLFHDKTLYSKLIKNGTEQLKSYMDSKKLRASSYLDICKKYR